MSDTLTRRPRMKIKADGSRVPPAPPAGAAPEELTPRKRGPNSGSFVKGVSGNPRGRPKNALSLKTRVRKAFGQKVTIRTPRGTVKVPLSDALILKELDRASAGDRAARAKVFEWMPMVFPEEALPTAFEQSGQAELGETGQAILDAFEAEILERNGLAPSAIGADSAQGDDDPADDDDDEE